MITETNIPKDEMAEGEKLYDLCMIEKLCRGNQQQVKQMLSVFVDQVPKAVKEIRSAYSENDFDQVKKAAHRIKPVLGFYAVIQLEEEIRLIESAASLLPQSEFEYRLNRVDAVVTNIVSQMKNTFLYQ